jgi:hypothetical protein
MRYPLLFAALLVALPAKADPDYYRLEVTRDESDLYDVCNTKLVIQTDVCFEFAMRDPAVLVWEYPGSWNNKLIFLDRDGKSKRSCRVKRLLAETSP